jgi:hypothetical protein
MRKTYNKKHKTGLWRMLAITALCVFSAPVIALGDEISDVFDQLMSTPDDPALNLRYAALAMAQGETRKALSAYERVLARDPNNAEARRAYKKAKLQLQPTVRAFTLTTGLSFESNPRQVPGNDPDHDDDITFEASLLMFDERTLAGHRWRTLGQAGGHLLLETDELNDATFSIASGPIFDVSKKTKLHIAPGAGIAILDDDWLYQDGLVRIALERRNKGNGQSVTTTVKYRDTNSSFNGDDGLIVNVDGRFLQTNRFRDGDAFYFLPRFTYSEPGGNGPGRVFQSALFPGNYIEYGARLAYFMPVANQRAFVGVGVGVYQRDYDQNVAFGTKDRSDVMFVPSAHFIVTNVRGSKFDFRLDYRFENNDSNDSLEDFDNHVASARLVRKY